MRSAPLNPFNTMAHILLAIYLVLVGLNILVDINLPSWIFGVTALAAGALMLVDRFRTGKSAK